MQGTDGIIKKIRETVGDTPVYLSIDVSLVVSTAVSFYLPFEQCRSTALTRRKENFERTSARLSFSISRFAPATGTPETGGWSTRELRTILRGLSGLHIVSADIVEVAPAYDSKLDPIEFVSLCSL